MSSAANRNFGLAQRHRERRINADLDNPGLRGVSADPAWDAFWGSLYEKGQQANADGLNFRADLSGLGQGGPSLASMRATRPGDQDTARTNAVNEYLGELTTRRRMEDQSLRAMTADADLRESGTAMARGDVADRQAMDRAYAIANTPGVTATGRQIMQTGDRAYATGGPVQPATVGERRALALSMSPGHLQPALEKTSQDAELARRTLAVNEGRLAEEVRSNKAKETAGPAPVSPEGVELAARNFLTTGQMPPLGMGDKTTRQRILDKAAELGGSGASIAANKADYKADSGSLAALQKQRDTIGAFEETAGKNIDIFLTAAGKIVDTGSPMANMLARHVTGKMLGSPDQAAFDAARQVAVNEIAKITSNPNLTGQLSDSARHEVDAFNPREATLAQSVAVMRLLKQDMTNRITSLDDAVKNIKGRIAQPSGGASGGGPVEMLTPDGRTISVPAGDVAEAKKLGAKPKGGG